MCARNSRLGLSVHPVRTSGKNSLHVVRRPAEMRRETTDQLIDGDSNVKSPPLCRSPRSAGRQSMGFWWLFACSVQRVVKVNQPWGWRSTDYGKYSRPLASANPGARYHHQNSIRPGQGRQGSWSSWNVNPVGPVVGIWQVRLKNASAKATALRLPLLCLHHSSDIRIVRAAKAIQPRLVLHCTVLL